MLYYCKIFMYTGKDAAESKKKWTTGPPPMDPNKLYVNQQEEDQMVIKFQGPVVQSIVSLTSSLRASHFFNKKYCHI